jgi:hypothetical protein
MGILGRQGRGGGDDDGDEDLRWRGRSPGVSVFAGLLEEFQK